MRLYLIVQAALQQPPPVWIRAASNCRDRKRDRRAEYKTITYFPHCKNNLFAFFQHIGEIGKFHLLFWNFYIPADLFFFPYGTHARLTFHRRIQTTRTFIFCMKVLHSELYLVILLAHTLLDCNRNGNRRADHRVVALKKLTFLTVPIWLFLVQSV